MIHIVELPPIPCGFCKRDIFDERWFARIRVGARRVAFCSPRCVEKFFDHPELAVPEPLPGFLERPLASAPEPKRTRPEVPAFFPGQWQPAT